MNEFNNPSGDILIPLATDITEIKSVLPVKVDASAFMYNVGVGGYYRFSDSWAFRFDIGNWVAVGIGTQL